MVGHRPGRAGDVDADEQGRQRGDVHGHRVAEGVGSGGERHGRLPAEGQLVHRCGYRRRARALDRDRCVPDRHGLGAERVGQPDPDRVPALAEEDHVAPSTDWTAPPGDPSMH